MSGTQYRRWLRSIRPFLTPEHVAMLLGDRISYMKLADLEALCELVFPGLDPRLHRKRR